MPRTLTYLDPPVVLANCYPVWTGHWNRALAELYNSTHDHGQIDYCKSRLETSIQEMEVLHDHGVLHPNQPEALADLITPLRQLIDLLRGQRRGHYWGLSGGGPDQAGPG